MYELEHFSSEISQLTLWETNNKSAEWKRIQNMSFCTRYIDDLWNLVVGKANFQETSRKQIYPPESGLVLGDPEHDGYSVNYLDMAIWFDSRSQQWHFKFDDKKLELVPKRAQAEQVSTSHIQAVHKRRSHVLQVACTRKRDSLAPAHSLYENYFQTGCSHHKVAQYFARFMRRHVPRYRPGLVL